jgi:regulator of sigma E protease
MEPTTLLYIAYAILGIGIIIFLHELGHFLAAKKVGVRVETFCLGFDPVIRGRRLRLFSFTRGDTVYAIGGIPFGGYVKMAGETALDRKPDSPPPRSDELLGKSAGARALVFAAGAIFNIISAFLFFILAFRIGVSFIAPVVGQVEPGKPAWRAGLRPGDRVLAIDGEKVNDFTEIAVSSALGAPDRPRSFVIERAGQALPPVAITPSWSAEHGFHTFGITPTFDPVIEKIPPESVAERAGLAPGDRLAGVRLDGFVIEAPLATMISALREFEAQHPGAPYELGVERKGEGRRWLKVEPKKAPSAKVPPVLGVSPALTVVEDSRPGSDASQALHPGDRILTAGGKRVFSLDWLRVKEEIGVQGPVELEVESVGGAKRAITIDAARLIAWSLAGDVKWAFPGLRVASLGGGSPLSGALSPGDEVVAVGPEQKPVFEPEEFSRWTQSQGGRVDFWYRRDGRVLRFEGQLPAGRTDLAVEWSGMPPVQVQPQSPAAKAGIPTGSTIEEIAGKKIRSWKDLREAVQEAEGKSVLVKFFPPDTARGATPIEKTVELTSGGREEFEPLVIDPPLLQVRVQAGIIESFSLGAKREVVVAKDVFLSIKGLISRQVEAKNLAGPVGIVSLIYRVSEFGFGTLIYYLALISVNLGLFNLLPFPILDGGHLLFLTIEKIKGSPVDVRIQEIATTVAFFLIIGLALFVTYNDLMRLIGR